MPEPSEPDPSDRTAERDDQHEPLLAPEPGNPPVVPRPTRADSESSPAPERQEH
jgi:hypothetical protein